MQDTAGDYLSTSTLTPRLEAPILLCLAAHPYPFWSERGSPLSPVYLLLV